MQGTALAPKEDGDGRGGEGQGGTDARRQARARIRGNTGGAAREWYCDALGPLEPYTFGNSVVLRPGGVRLMLTEEDGGGGRIQGRHLGACPISTRPSRRWRRAVWCSPMRRNRIHCHDECTEEWMAFFEDNEGRLLALSLMTQSPVH